MIVPTYIPTNNAWKLQLHHIPTLLILAIQMVI